MNEGGDHKSRGFTIVETLIVLAVTGTLFFSAVALINGRQNKTQFSTAINNLQQQIQQIINETQSGFYGDSSNYNCDSPSGVPKLTAGSNVPSGNCQFLGKFIQFGTDPDPSALVVYPMVGSTRSAFGANTDVASSNPTAVAPFGVINTVDATQTYRMEQGLTVASDAGSTPAMSFKPFASGLSQQKTGSLGFLVGDKDGTIAVSQVGGYKSGSLQLTLYGVKSSSNDMTKAMMTSLLNPQTSPPQQLLTPAQSASICIASGTTNQSGLITINSGLSVSLAIKTGLVC